MTDSVPSPHSPSVMTKETKNMNVAPPVINSARLMYYAINDNDVEFTNKISLFVGGSEGELEPLGEVYGLAIAETYREPKEYLLMLCNVDWDVKGVIPFATSDEAKIRAERGYKGISSKWKISPYSDEEILDFLRNEYDVDPLSEWWITLCSFCGRKDSEFKTFVAGPNAQICEHCIREFYAMVNEEV